MLFVFSRSRLSWQQSHESTQALLVESKTASFCELPQLLSVDKSKGGRGGRTRYLYSFSSSIIDSSQLRTRVLSANKWGVYNYSVACSLSFTLSLSLHLFSQAQDLDAVIRLHSDYVFAVHNRCLLHKKVKSVICMSRCLAVWCELSVVSKQAGYVMEAITKILTLTLNFHKKWMLGLAHFRWATFCVTFSLVC